MNLRRHVPKFALKFALAALVAGAAVLVYALYGNVPPFAEAKNAAAQTKNAPSSDSLPDTSSAAKDTSPSGEQDVLYDATTLPEPVQRILRKIILAAQTGDVEAMRPVLESNELKPMVAASHVDDPIAYWKEHSTDGTGRDVLAAMLNMLNGGFVQTGEGLDAMYVWPYFAEVGIKGLSPQQQVELYRAVPPNIVKTMREKGTYSYYRIGISPTGVWHYFLQ